MAFGIRSYSSQCKSTKNKHKENIMPAITVSDVDTASVIANLAIAGGAVLAVAVVGFGWRKIIGFFGR